MQDIYTSVMHATIQFKPLVPGNVTGMRVVSESYMAILSHIHGSGGAGNLRPGCVATGSTPEEAEQNMHDAIKLHVQGLKEDDLPVPEPHSFAKYLAV